jgi:hypothetical protein
MLNGTDVTRSWLPLVLVGGVVLLILLKVGFGSDVSSIFALVIAMVVGAFAAVVIGKMINNEIDLALLVSEDNGNASLSRFQFLIFTFVIAASYFLLVTYRLATSKGDGLANLPEIPNGVLGPIGISGGSYVISKGIQKSAEGQTPGVLRVDIVANGAGYSAETVVQFVGGGGSGASAKVEVDANGAITKVIIDNSGAGYTSAPQVTFKDPHIPPGSGATATAVLG